MQLRAGNSGPVAGFLVTGLPTTAPITVGAAGHVDASVTLAGALVGDFYDPTVVIEAAGAGLIATGATCTVAGTVTVRIENPSAAPIGPTTPHLNLWVWHPSAVAES